MNRLSTYVVLLLALATLCAGLPLAKRDLDCGNSNDCIDYDNFNHGDSYATEYSHEKYLRIITPNSGTVWQADSFQSVTWAFDGSAHLGYSEKVIVILLAIDNNGHWKKVDTLQSGTTGSGISNYHVRKDLGKAHAYKVVLQIEKVHFSVESEPFRIKSISGHSNEGDYYEEDSYSHEEKNYLRPITPNSQTVWDADSFQSATWSYDGSSNLGYGETVEVFLFARQSDGSWKKVDELPSATTGSGISNYHVRKDLGKASAYIVVLVIDKVHYQVATEPFKIKQISGHSNEGDYYEEDSYSHEDKNYLRPITPNSQTVWDADSFQSATWSYDGSSNLGYGETVEVFLFARQSDGSWKKVDELPSATTGSGISNYHVRKDLGKASAYIVVLVIDKVHYQVATEPFKIKQISGHSNEGDYYEEDSYSHEDKNYLRPITPNSQTIWDADSFQSATWSYDGSSNLGYGETVEVFLFARQSDGSWKKVDELPSATTGSGISNYHVRKDLGKASAYIVVLVIDKVHYQVATEPFKIKQISGHSNEGDYYEEDSYSHEDKNYLRPITPNSQTVWDADSFQSATWSYDGSSNLGYGETVEVFLFARQSDGSWKKVDELPSATTGSGISNYHVRKDLGKASAYIVVLVIDKVHYQVATEPFKIKSISSHSNGDESDPNSESPDEKQYLTSITPTYYTVWDADTDQSVTWKYDGSSNLGFSEPVSLALYARKVPGDWEFVENLPSGTTGGGISNYHVRKDLGEADYYLVVLQIDSIHYAVSSGPFIIKKTSDHQNSEDYDTNGSDNHNTGDDSSKYAAITSPDTQSVWKTGSDVTINWTYEESSIVKSDDKVRLTLYSYDTKSKSVKEVGDIGEWDVSTGSASYHVPDDVEIADFFVIVFTFERVQHRIHSEPFKIEHSW
ncbi:hypothetical protein BC943DRAFT_315817 [Umbelopsis sp. AD052]|nr:hypothetical protein BC943DRAFT_315817 [Umbelopsis sp. AD052]